MLHFAICYNITLHIIYNDSGGNCFGDSSSQTGCCFREGANKRGNSSRLTQSFHFFMFEPIFSPVNALNQPI
ncbi:hypothetical protein CDN89_11385 [Escherichia coli]|nr:hypothetical protein CDN89_11385 [Escherichia coli]